LLIGCAGPPFKSTAKNLIKKYLESKEITVIEIEIIGDIKPTKMHDQSKHTLNVEDYRVKAKMKIEVPKGYTGQEFKYRKGSIASYERYCFQFRKKNNKWSKWTVMECFLLDKYAE
jgi:hypothetical protein